jgi:hypothetical protein
LSDKPHPKRIGTSYRGAFARPEDAVRERANEERKAALEAHEPLEAAEMPTAQWAAAFDQEVAKYAAENVTEAGGQRVDQAIASVVAEAEARLEAASLTPERRMARAIAEELRGQVLETGSGDLYVPTEDDIDYQAELEAFLEAPDEDTIVGTDVDGRTIFEDANGERYVLKDQG